MLLQRSTGAATAGDLNLAIGGMVAPNLAIPATIFGRSVNDPKAGFSVAGVG